jgi:hypothetical protein
MNAQTVTGHLQLKTHGIPSTMILRIRTYRRDLKENGSFLALHAWLKGLSVACMAHVRKILLEFVGLRSD